MTRLKKICIIQICYGSPNSASGFSGRAGGVGIDKNMLFVVSELPNASTYIVQSSADSELAIRLWG